MESKSMLEVRNIRDTLSAKYASMSKEEFLRTREKVIKDFEKFSGKPVILSTSQKQVFKK